MNDTRTSKEQVSAAPEPTSYVVEGDTYRALIAERDRLRTHLRQKSEQITRLQDGIEKMQQGSSESSAHEPRPTPGTATMYAQQHDLAVTAEWCRGWNAHMDALEGLPPGEVAERSMLTKGFQMPAASSPPPGASQLAWLIERQENGRAVWYTSNFQWTTDANEAMWFVRKLDAELFLWNTEVEASAVEHMFCSQPALTKRAARDPRCDCQNPEPARGPAMRSMTCPVHNDLPPAMPDPDCTACKGTGQILSGTVHMGISEKIACDCYSPEGEHDGR